MGLQETAAAERIHIGVFGMRNAGKSSLVNAITGQKLSVISDVKGTTTDPVRKAMELLPLGPVVIIDTPGFDDEGELGSLRVEKTKQVLSMTDIAVMVVDIHSGMQKEDNDFLLELQKRQVPYIIVYNKAEDTEDMREQDDILRVSALTGKGIHELKNKLGSFAGHRKTKKCIIADMIKPGDIVLLVTPIDESAPKGRLILPQQMTLREILDIHAVAVTCQETEVADVLKTLGHKPKIVITDSQVFEQVSREVPQEIPLTSFSILMARYKGDLEELLNGADALDRLRDGDSVLISEGCTHHRQCNDIGTVKMPGWIEAYTGAKLKFSFSNGGDFPENLIEYQLVVHCGGCMLNEAQMQERIRRVKEAGIPMVNYGLAIAKMHGILKRSVECLDK